MKLTGPEIRKRINDGSIVITPFVPEHVGPNSVDLRLAPELVVYDCIPHLRDRTDVDMARSLYSEKRKTRQARITAGVTCEFQSPLCHPELDEWTDVIDMKARNPTYKLTIPDSGLVLIPGRLYLGQTMEYTETHNCVPCIEGRSSIGRLGISTHATAGFGDVGYCGTWTLEISVTEPVRVYAGVRFVQLHFETVQGDIQLYKSDKYQGERLPTASALWKDFIPKE